MSIGELFSLAEQDRTKRVSELRTFFTRRSQDRNLTERQRDICRECIKQLDHFMQEVGVM